MVLSEARDRLSVRFWGVRGSIACPGPEYARFGGNTSCVEIRCGGDLLIFDGGTGLRPLGLHLKSQEPIDADLFFSHSHLDHISGLPFFGALFNPGNRFRMWAGHLIPHHTLKDVLGTMMTPPLFPVPIEIFTAETSYIDFVAGETLYPRPGVTLRTAPLNHPNGATGYRLEFEGHSVCYVTDTEHVLGRIDRRIVDLVRGTDLFIYDAMFTDDEYPRYSSWGHSTWQEGIRLANAAEVRTLVVFHHDPNHDDDFMARIADSAGKARPGTMIAREGMILTP